ncbi:hypothetical protein O4215_20620 [Rhodococcus maanshanensis]|uniref:hypothetical protein n=1 Tax=Rhodococcus maanshanensis TaxID=183556 RepID=UPI0022B4C8C4|nr:hypothetical protein [Rhodococcus maanshanensis]MCZ4557969.1 hypothetical protein [Rhodococcus maanshanensis]
MSTPSLLEGTERFMRAAGQHIPDRPERPEIRTLALRLAMLAEEVDEACKAAGIDLFTLGQAVEHGAATGHATSAVEFLVEEIEHAGTLNPVNTTELVDAYLDIGVVAWGGVLETAGAEAGNACADEVTRSNLAKIGPDGMCAKSPAGKVLKPADWTPPEIGLVLAKHRHPSHRAAE